LIDTTRRLLWPLGGYISIDDRYVLPSHAVVSRPLSRPHALPDQPGCTNAAWMTKASRSSLLQPTLVC
jgi:hypothetical protein